MTTSNEIDSAPWSDYDLYSDAALLDPWPGYRALRDAGPAVWLPKYEMFALPVAVVLPAGSRAIVLYGSGSRDERRYADPDRFDVQRRPGDHLAFGAGPHACVGMNLARMEMLAIFTAPAERVRRFEIVEAEPVLHNILRGFRTLRVTVT